MHRPLTLTFFFLSCLLGWPSTYSPIVADEPADSEIKFPVEMGSYSVKLVSPDDKPIVGAAVLVNGVRCAEDPGSWYSWPTTNAGKDNSFITDENGEATFEYPKFLGAPPDYSTITTLTFNFSHSGFVSDRAEAAIDELKTTHTLQPGCRVVFTAVDEQQQSIDRFGCLIGGPSPDWKLSDGTIQSSAVPSGKWQTMLVAPREDGVTLFSGILPARYASGGEFKINNVRLSPGLRVQGKLSDNVPRPIVDGVVIAFSQPKPTPEAIEKREAISWTDAVKIAADGSFEFASLPASGRLQLISVCRDWVIVDQAREGNPLRGGSKQGILLDLDNTDIKSNLLDKVVLDMEPTGTLEVTVVDGDGNPVSDIRVGTNPNQLLEDYGSQILGESYVSLDVMREQWDPAFEPPTVWDPDRQSRYYLKSSINGKATIYSMPVGGTDMLYAGSDKYQMVDNADQPNRSMQIGFDKSETKQVTIIVERIPETK
ncbi:MAG: hypothetical protein ABI557_02250 [Aureliella sp.]